MRLSKGVTTTAGISIIAIAIVVVGVAIYFVYTRTQTTADELSISIDETVVLTNGSEHVLTGTVTSGSTETVSLAISKSNAIGTLLSPQSIAPNENFSLTLTAYDVTDEVITLQANQGTQEVTRSISVKVVSDSVDTNQETNNSNTNLATNTNTTSAAGTFIDGQMNLSTTFSSEWGIAELLYYDRFKPVSGDYRYYYFTNVDRIEIPGYVYISAATSDFEPEQYAGTPFWFSGKISPTADNATLEAQMKEAGFTPLHFETVTIDGIAAVKVFLYRGFYNNYLDIAYIIPLSREKFDTVLMGRTLDIVAEKDASVDAAIEGAEELYQQIVKNEASEQVMRRYNQFEDMIDNLHFIR